MLATASACTTTRTTVAPRVPANRQRLGAATGKACSSIAVWAGALQVAPIGAADRFNEAYHAALESVPGATALTDVTFRENWYWAVYGTVYCTTISGEAIR